MIRVKRAGLHGPPVSFFENFINLNKFKANLYFFFYNLGKTCMCSSDLECPICLESHQNPIVTNCGHIICGRCMMEYMRYRKSCPICRNPLIKNLFMTYSKQFHGTKGQKSRNWMSYCIKRNRVSILLVDRRRRLN